MEKMYPSGNDFNLITIPKRKAVGTAAPRTVTATSAESFLIVFGGISILKKRRTMPG